MSGIGGLEHLDRDLKRIRAWAVAIVSMLTAASVILWHLNSNAILCARAFRPDHRIQAADSKGDAA